MASTGNVFAGTGENNAGIGATAWTTPGNVVSDNATDATCAAAASSQYLVARNFALSSVPANATIDGITVRAEASEHSGGTEALKATLQDAAGALFGAEKSLVISGTAKAVYTYGGAADLWSATITGAIVHDADFGVRFNFLTAHTVNVDYVTLAVEYTVPGPGIATETDAALALAVVKVLGVGVAAETDLALAPLVENQGGTIEVPTGLGTETDAALALGRVKIRAAGVSAETDASLGLGRTKIRALGLSLEADLALALSLGTQIATGRADETDLALGLARTKIRAVGAASESDSGFALGAVKLRAVSASLETDAALSTYVATVLVAMGLAVESDSAIGLSRYLQLPPFIVRHVGARP